MVSTGDLPREGLRAWNDGEIPLSRSDRGQSHAVFIEVRVK